MVFLSLERERARRWRRRINLEFGFYAGSSRIFMLHDAKDQKACSLHLLPSCFFAFCCVVLLRSSVCKVP